MWNAQLPALLGAGLQVVTIDQRGHGRSGRPATGYDLDTMAADVLLWSTPSTSTTSYSEASRWAAPSSPTPPAGSAARASPRSC
jgi:alpha-beta hydrolase superfamily lysophospholipase